jgi:hypothetical protein
MAVTGIAGCRIPRGGAPAPHGHPVVLFFSARTQRDLIDDSGSGAGSAGTLEGSGTARCSTSAAPWPAAPSATRPVPRACGSSSVTIQPPGAGSVRWP